jgi:hypothetical protein
MAGQPFSPGARGLSATPLPPRIMRKGEYARYRSVDPCTVSLYIREGKLAAPAIRPDGLVDRVLADKMLAQRLDMAKSRKHPGPAEIRTAPKRGPRWPAKVGRPPVHNPAHNPGPVSGPELDDDFSSYQSSRARREQATADLAQAKLAKVRGDLIEASAAHEMARELGLLVAETLDARRMELAHRMLGCATVADALAILSAADRQWRLDLANAITARVEVLARAA